MSVRVNLLPQEAAAKHEMARQRKAVLGGAVVLLLVLGLAYVWQLSRVQDARAELAAEEEQVSALEAEVAALDEFDDLRDRRREAQQALQDTMRHEITVAGILQDLAAVLPSDAQVDDFVLSLSDEASIDAATAQTTVGSFTLVGQTLTSHAPGVERVLLSLDKVVSFVDVFVESSALQDPDEPTASFSLEGRLGSESLTRRYDEGLPEELR